MDAKSNLSMNAIVPETNPEATYEFFGDWIKLSQKDCYAIVAQELSYAALK